MVRNFESFQEGHWYIYTGIKREGGWNDNGYMDFVLGHKPQKCVHGYYDNAMFICANSKEHVQWRWGNGFDNWIEIRDPNRIWWIKAGEKYYSRTLNKIFINTSDHSQPCSGAPFYTLIDSKCIEDDDKTEEFKVGDTVKIIKKFGKGDISWCPEMDEYIGDFGKIETIENERNGYKIRFQDNDCWWFCKESLEKINLLEDLSAKYKVGDKVRIGEIVEKWRGNSWVSEMDRFVGQVVTICKQVDEFQFKIEEDSYLCSFPYECIDESYDNKHYSMSPPNMPIFAMKFTYDNKRLEKQKFTKPKTNKISFKVKKSTKKFAI